MNRIFLKAPKFKDYKKFSVLILGLILISSLVSPQSAFAVTANFSFPTSPANGNLGSDTDVSQLPQLVADGNSVYVVWRDADDIKFSRSPDNGDIFSTHSDIGDIIPFTGVKLPQIAVSGTGVYVVWEDGDDLRLRASTDGGASLEGDPGGNGAIIAGGSPADPQIAASPTNVFVTWSDGTDILLSSSTQGANTFTQVTLDDTSASTSSPQIAVTNSRVYAVWATNTSVLFASSIQGTISFSTQVLGSGNTDSAPQIVAINNEVHVIWKDGSDDVQYTRSVNNGIDFSSPSDIGDADASAEPQIATAGNNVYVVWEDGPSEIRFRASTNSGASLEGNPSGSGTNLSGTVGSSIFPQISASGTFVFVAWEDRDAAFDTSGDIVYVVSGDSGADLSSASPQNISSTPSDSSKDATIDSSGNKVYVAWQDSVNSPADVLFKTGVIAGPTISFDQLEYNVKETATITVSGDVSTCGATPYSVAVTSLSDPTTGISVDLTETPPSSGTFIGTVDFTNTGSSNDVSDILEADSGDTLTAAFCGNGGTSKIVSSSMPLPDIDNGDYETIISIEVIDENANLDPSSAETITVTLTSNIESITVQLTETGLDTGVFGGATSSAVIFMTGDHEVSVGNVELTQDYSEDCGFCTPGVVDTVDLRVTSTSDSVGIVKTLIETDLDTELFSGTLTLSSSSVNGTSIEAVPSDFITLNPIGIIVSNQNLLVNPTTASRNGIQVEFPIVLNPDIVQITYKDSLKTFTPADGGAGGGGGGLVRPGLVVNVLAGSTGGGGGLPGPTMVLGYLALNDNAVERISMPQEIRDFINDDFDPHTPLEPITDVFEDYELPLSINGNGFALGGYENTLVPKTVKRGEPIEFTLVFYTTSEIAHSSLNFNLGVMRTIAGSDTQVLLYKDKFEIIDPNGNIATATGSINNEGDLKRVVTFSITFSDDIQWSNSDFVIRSWNDNMNSGDIIVYDAIQVLPSEEEIAFEQSLPEPEVEQLKSQYVPIWIKNNASWWALELIDDSDFVAGIEYLIQKEIITISENGNVAANGSDEIPTWIKNNAGWWSEDLITEQEFIDGLQWLISNNVIMVVETG